VSGSGRDNGARPFVTIRPWLRVGLLGHLSPTASRVLFLMVDHCGTDGLSYPSAKTLAEESGHARKVVYGALKELCEIGCLECVGQTRWSSHNHPGPLMYAIRVFDDRAAERLRRLDSRKESRGDAARFSKVSQTQEHLNGSRCTSGCPQGVPADARQGVPVDALKGVPNTGTLRAFGAEHSEQSLSQSTPPSPPTGGTPAPGGPVAGAGGFNGSGNGNEKRATKAAERMREDVRRLFEAEATVSNGLKSLEHYQRWFPKTYDPAMVADVFQEVQQAHGS
jgi:hypothetical protein